MGMFVGWEFAVECCCKFTKSSQIFALHVDLGFMRLDESAKVEKALKGAGIDLTVVDGTCALKFVKYGVSLQRNTCITRFFPASKTFYEATTIIDDVETEKLKDTVRPEVKRKIIGDTYMKISNQAVADFGLEFDDVILAQGTLRPDLIESASKLVRSRRPNRTWRYTLELAPYLASD